MLPRLVALSVAIALAALAIPAAAPALLRYLQLQQETAAGSETSAARATTVSIPAGDDGHFRTSAVIDGRTVPVVIDTGTTTIALSVDTARSLGFNLTGADYTAKVETANGVVRGAQVTLRSIRVGNVVVHDVSAVVLPGDSLALNLLGMGFLNRLTKFEAAGGQLVLVQ
jgi:aspartyl protease family protein